MKDVGLTLNREKCKFRQSQVEFLGHILDQNGVHPTQERVAAIRKLQEPTDMHGVRQLNGMINFVSRFLPDIAKLLSPITDLLSSKVSFVWGPAQIAVKKFKQILSSNQTLALFNPKRETVVSADFWDRCSFAAASWRSI